MTRVIRIGTRDSELALWQATTVKDQLEYLGYQTQLVPVKSTGDLVLDKPLYELGITGIFTKTLDVALLQGEIDVAVHSLKDVPTALPKGIVQAAVLERANFLDLLVYKKNQEFLGQREALIATGSLRRKAQWLHRYPTHTITDLRGNVNSRLQKLEDHNWNGAIFAAAGLNRIGLEPENTIGLTWMVPAPAQGAIMVAALESDQEVQEACARLNHEPTEICTDIEREFLRLLEGGCTAPIGALATIKPNGAREEVTLKGVLLSVDGKQRLEVELMAPVGKHQHLAKDSANSILNRGGRRLMRSLGQVEQKTTIYSTKKITPEQQQLFRNGIHVDSEDFVKINPSRISAALLKKPIRNVVITSKNAVESLLTSTTPDRLQFEQIYCVGRKTKRLIERHFGQVAHFENSARKLADYLVEFMDGTEVTYFCSNIRLDDLPKILKENNITVNEIEAYKTKHDSVTLDASVEGVLFYSPSTIDSYLLNNKPDRIAYCIGETTAGYARKYFSDVRVARIPDTESLIELVNEDYG